MVDALQGPEGFVRTQLDAGNTPQNIADSMVLRGHSSQDAARHVNSVIAAINRPIIIKERRRAPWEIILGIAIIVLGVLGIRSWWEGSFAANPVRLFSVPIIGGLFLLLGVWKLMRK